MPITTPSSLRDTLLHPSLQLISNSTLTIVGRLESSSQASQSIGICCHMIPHTARHSQEVGHLSSFVFLRCYGLDVSFTRL